MEVGVLDLSSMCFRPSCHEISYNICEQILCGSKATIANNKMLTLG